MGGAWRTWVVCGGLAVGLLGCTGSVVGGGDGGQSTSSGGDGGTAGGGGAGGDGGGTNAGGSGNVGLLMENDHWVAFAWFTDEVGDCAPITKKFGECGYRELSSSCPNTAKDPGIVTIQSPSATTLLTAEESSKTDSVPLFQPGETLQMSSTGAEIPAFSGSVVAPPAVVLTAPSFAGPTTLNTSQDLVVAWPPTTGKVIVVLASGSGAKLSVACRFDGAAGTGKMPPEALAAFPEKQGQLIVYSIDTSFVMAGDWPVTLVGQVRATDAQGKWATMPVTLQ